MASSVKVVIELWYNTSYGRDHQIFEGIDKFFENTDVVEESASGIEVELEYTKDGEISTREKKCSNKEELLDYLTRIQLEINDPEMYLTLLNKALVTFKDKYVEKYPIVDRDNIEISIDTLDVINIKSMDSKGNIVKEETLNELEEEEDEEG